MADKSIWKDLTWGHGPLITDWFLEPTCPHCARAFSKLRPLLDKAGEDRLSVRITLQSQPWHLFSGVVSRAVLAATLSPGGRDSAWKVLAAVYKNREEYVAEEHSHGPNMEVTFAEILARIVEQSGVDVRETFERKEVTALFKMHTRYARQNGIHASPTVMVDGLVNDRIASRGEVDEWLAAMNIV